MVPDSADSTTPLRGDSSGFRAGPTSRYAAGPLSARLLLPRLLAIPILTGYLVLAATGHLQFSIWPQVLDHAYVSPLEVNFFTEAHGLRYILMYPILFLAHETGIEGDVLFTGEVMLMMLAVPVLLDRSRAIIRHDNRPWGWERVFFLLFFTGLSLTMNGRLAFAFLGISLLLWTMLRFERHQAGPARTIGFIGLALFLASVSTGTFMVALGTVVGWAALLGAWPGRLFLREAAIAGIVLFGALLAAPLVELYVYKNLNFYEGDIVNMLNHGPGVVLYEGSPWLTVPLVAGGAVLGTLLLAGLLLAYPYLRPPILVMTFAACFGVFGYSTLSMGLPALLLFLTTVPSRRPLALGSPGGAARHA
jgi:hypothetical protein